MFYKIVSLALVAIGVLHTLLGISWPIEINEDFFSLAGIGLSTVFIGLLNYVYVYESPSSSVPQFILLSANILFIGFAILLITSGIHVEYGWAAVVLSIINCMMVLNHKV